MASPTSVSRFPNGRVQICYVDDGVQGDGNPTNVAHQLTTNAAGTLLTGGTGYVWGFAVERVQPPPPAPALFR